MAWKNESLGSLSSLCPSAWGFWGKAWVWLLHLLQAFPPHQVLWCERGFWKTKQRSQIPGVSMSCRHILYWKLLVCTLGQKLETSHRDFMCNNSPFSQAVSGGPDALNLSKDIYPPVHVFKSVGSKLYYWESTVVPPPPSVLLLSTISVISVQQQSENVKFSPTINIMCSSHSAINIVMA